ncbi:MAG TPA: DUF3471 domain-containing protein [Terriglobia bacterium]|nr:DUF3471 domain-containing protein [Terriglobia bacterium]
MRLVLSGYGKAGRRKFSAKLAGKTIGATLREEAGNRYSLALDREIRIAPGQTLAGESTLSPAILAQYVGTYELAPGFGIVMTIENGQMMTQATGQFKFPLFAESESKFFLKVVDAEVEFFKNDKGEVDHLVLHQGGHETKGVKK